MAAKSTFGNMVLVLSGICLVCSALLGTVYAVTKAPIEASELRKVNTYTQSKLNMFTPGEEFGI